MTAVRPPLAKVDPGMPITSGGWNAIVGAVQGLYTDLGDAGRERLEVAVSSRGAPVAGASVVATAVAPSGPSRTAALAPKGPATHVLPELRAGTWQIVVQAPGYERAMREVRIPRPPTESDAPLTVQMTRVTVPAPDLVGIAFGDVGLCLGWAQLPWLRTMIGSTTKAVIAQGPAPGTQIPRGDTIAVVDGNVAPWRTVVPDLTGFPVAQVENFRELRLVIPAPATPASGARIAKQSVEPGQVVALGATVELEVTPAVVQETTFGAYSGTHAKLSGVRVLPLLQEIAAHADRLLQSTLLAPWSYGRTYASDADIAQIVDLVVAAGVGVAVSAAPNEDLAAVWRSVVVANHLRFT